MRRTSFERNGLRLSYLDSEGTGPLIVALHAMWMEARTFEAFAAAMPEWRVVSMDQRGHGLSDHAQDYSRAAFVEDIAGLLDHLGSSVRWCSSATRWAQPTPSASPPATRGGCGPW